MTIKASIVKAEKLTDIIVKAENPLAIGVNEKTALGMVGLTPDYDPNQLLKYVRESTILPQCINAYKRNIVGYGIGITYVDTTLEETPEMKAEFDRLKEVLSTLSLVKPLKEVWETLIEQRESQAYSFLEVVTDDQGLPIEITNIEDISTIHILAKEDKATEYKIYRNGVEYKKYKRFRKYKQEVNGKTVYFKEYGDPRIMDCRTGKYVDYIDDEYEANSLIHFKNGYGVYGTPRWEGCLLTVDGARKAEKLNYNYFTHGRHTPLMLLVQGGTLSDSSWAKLQEYMNDIEGEKGQHGFLVLEAESLEPNTSLEEKESVKVEVKPLAEILQKDELFQEYLKNHRQKVQSSFNLPDIYVGYSQDYNVATAKEIVKKTEEQVFQPERDSLEWILNQVILSPYGFKYVKAYFKSPDIENTDSQYKMLTIAKDKMSVNQVLEEYYGAVNKDFEPFEDEWANIPQFVFDKLNSTINNPNGNEDIIPVLKSVRKALKEVNERTYP